MWFRNIISTIKKKSFCRSELNLISVHPATYFASNSHIIMAQGQMVVVVVCFLSALQYV